MSVQSQINRIEQNVANTYAVLAGMGADMPAAQNSDNLSATAASAFGKLTFDPTVYGLPVLELTGDISPIKISKDNKATLSYVYGDRSGSCTLKGQGATSYKMAKAFVDAGKAGKFNYTIKFDNAFEAFDGWGEQQKYCLKANWIDHTHCRNVVSAKLWGKVRKNRSGLDSNLSALPNAGAVDGFPIVIMLNGEFHGLYTFNIPKDGWMFGLAEDSTKTQAIVGANDHTTATQFKGECLVDESDFELEFVSDEDNADWVATSLNRLINACIDSWGGDLDTVIAQYVDLKSVVDYIIFTVLIDGRDCTDKNYILATFDGTKWFFSAYDLDSTYGLRWNASKLHRPDDSVGDAVTLDKLRSVHRLFELIIRFKTDELKARYAALRKSVLSEYALAEMFENFAWAIPSPVLEEDVKLYPTILGSSVNSVDQILRWLHHRLTIVDAWIEALPAQETPTVPEPEGITNRVPTAIDTDGSVFNGTGYKDGVRLSGNPPAESSKSGMVITGYIPVTAGDVIRMAGTTWGTSPASTYVFLYDADFKCLGSYNGGGYVGMVNYLPDTTKDETVFQDKSLQSVTTDNGVATFNLKFHTADKDNTTGSGQIASSRIAYMRISAIGNGADMIITLNEEIT